MAKFATIVTGVALVLAQPVTTAFAAPAAVTQTDAGVQGSNSRSFTRDPAKIAVALAALSAATWGLINALKKGNHGRRPTSP